MNNIDKLIEQGIIAQNYGDLIKTEAIYKEVLRLDPENIDVLPALGTIYFHLGKINESLFFLDRMIQKQPENIYNYVNLIKVLFGIKNFDKCELVCKNTLSKFPNNDIILYLTANTLSTNNKKIESIEYYKKAININPNNFDYSYDLGTIFMYLEKFDESIEYYQKALAINPYSDKTNNNLAYVLKNKKEYDKALKHYEKSVELSDNIIFNHNLAKFSYEAFGNYNRSSEIYKKLDRKSNNKIIYKLAEILNLPIIAKNNNEIIEAKNRLNDFLEQDFSNYKFDYNSIAELNLIPPYILRFYGDNDKNLKEKFSSIFNKSFQPLKTTFFQNDKIHISFLVTDGHEDIFVKSLSGFLEKLAIKDFKISIICPKKTGLIKIKPKILSETIEYIEVDNNNLFESYRKIHSQKIDVLYYWEIGSHFFNYILPHLKPAKIQVTSWGVPCTSGIKNIDYFISSKKLELDNYQDFYSEKVYLLNNIPVFYKKNKLNESSNYNNKYLPDNKNIYLYSQNIRKLLPDYDILFKNILEKDNKGIIVIIEDKYNGITNLLKERLKNNLNNLFERILFIPRIEHFEYLEIIKKADVSLDIKTYSGTNTSYDSFLCGTPMPNFYGKNMQENFTKAIYQQANIKEISFDNDNDYINKIYEIANNKEYREYLKEKIINSHDLIFENEIVIDEFESFIRDICK
ncbi:MAG: tetratricopeptide repeat protein [Cyanobacteriota bacterium]